MTEGPRESIRECECPPWVVQCAHWDGQMVCLGKTSPLPQGCHRCNANIGTKYGVITYAGAWGPCTVCGGASLWTDQIRKPGSRHDDLGSAQDEFRHREAQLLGREV